jgi:hypothetical protein
MLVVRKPPDTVGLWQAEAFGIGDAQRDRAHVGIGSVLVAADPIPGVRGHVDEMARVGRQRGQSVGIGLGARGLVGYLGRVDVEMDRGGVVGIARQDGFEQRHRMPRIGCPRAGGARGDEPGVGGDGADFIVGRVGGDEPVHPPGKGKVAVVAAVARLERGDEVVFALGGAGTGRGIGEPGGGVGDGCERGDLGRVLVIVDRRAGRPGLPPSAHRAGGIKPPCLSEGGDRGSVSEGVGQLHAIVEKGLRGGRGSGDEKTALTIAGEQGRDLGDHIVVVASVTGHCGRWRRGRGDLCNGGRTTEDGDCESDLAAQTKLRNEHALSFATIP